jgi:predicted RNA-binding protein YlxR (DUF448 family)
MISPERQRSLEPTRTCVGCRRLAPVSTLARLALRDGVLVRWGTGRSRPGGRGASLHPDASCLRAALKQGAFARAFRGRVERFDEAEFLQQLTAATAALRSRNRESS